MSTEILEESLFIEVMKKLAEMRKEQVEYVISGVVPPEVYAYRVGRIHEIDEMQTYFDRLYGAFFPGANVKQK